jgi:hydrogenase expression/formation protein HypE
VNPERVLLGHGGGGLLTRQLIEQVLLPSLDNPLLRPLDDAALLCLEPGTWAMTTDSYVVSPLFFPGGDIGKLAVCGTVNDLAVMGAEPRWMTLGLVLEEGLLVSDLRAIVESLGMTAREAGVAVVAGDTKVVERGKCDGVYINTAGVGRLTTELRLGAASILPGDAVIVSGFLGDHGISVLARRSGIALPADITSDCAALWTLVERVLSTGAPVHAMRDLTRGGLAACVNEMADRAGAGIRIWESKLRVRDAVRGACNLLGFDPLTIANEGKIVLFCPGDAAEAVLAAMRSHPLGEAAEIVGEVSSEPKGMALLVGALGGQRIIDMPVGEDLPRIC